jgi:hypothetical protein
MARTRDAESTNEMELIHPVYLNVPMMVSFLAAIQGGVSYENEITARSQTAKDLEAEGGGRAGLPGISSLLGLNLDMQGRLKRRSAGEEAVETKVIREHTEASLFNLLRHRLGTEKRALQLDGGSLDQLTTGELIEVTGEVLGNPLQQVLDFIYAIAPYLGVELEEEKSSPSAGSRNPKARPAQRKSVAIAENEGFGPAEAELFRTMRRDADRSRVRDLILQTQEGPRAILTLDREFLQPKTEEYMVGGRFTVLGKVTAVLAGDEQVNLMRRTALGTLGAKMARELFSSLQQADEDFSFNLPDPVVSAPAIQILPLAIFV